MIESFRSGFVTILGKPNVGKSTLMNILVGEKLSITSSKPQTTRLSVKGIYNDTEKQIIFLDTPGYLKPRYELQKKMLKQFSDSLNDADVVLFITEKLNFPTDYDCEILEILKSVKRPKIALINKSDQPCKICDETIINQIPPDFASIFFISAINGNNIEKIIPAITKFLPFNPPYYETDQLSDLPLRFFAQESIREAVFRQFGQEIPYSSAVLINKFEELESKIVIYATIWIEKESQKPIIIGKNGTGLKKIREYAEIQLLKFMQTQTDIHLWVKVKKNWRKSNSALKELGFRD
jgi:GTP-binding protein Era